MKLLIGVSRIPFDARSLDTIAKLAGTDTVWLLHVDVERRKAPDAGGNAATARLRLEHGTPALAQMQASLTALGVQTEVLVRHGDAADMALKTAREVGADIIVMRAHDRNPSLLQRVFGDTVTRVMERADRPVLALRSGEAARGRGVLLASGRPGVVLLDTTAQVAKATRSPVTVLHVIATAQSEDFFGDMLQGPDGAPMRDAPRPVVGTDRAVQALATRDVQATARVREGIVEEQLAREANEGDHWLLIVRGRTTGRFFRALFGHSFTEDLIRHVRTSILIVK